MITREPKVSAGNNETSWCPEASASLPEAAQSSYGRVPGVFILQGYHDARKNRTEGNAVWQGSGEKVKARVDTGVSRQKASQLLFFVCRKVGGPHAERY